MPFGAFLEQSYGIFSVCMQLHCQSIFKIWRTFSQGSAVMRGQVWGYIPPPKNSDPLAEKL